MCGKQWQDFSATKSIRDVSAGLCRKIIPVGAAAFSPRHGTPNGHPQAPAAWPAGVSAGIFRRKTAA